jgi:hypothetical protein
MITLSKTGIKKFDQNQILRDAVIRVSNYHYVVDLGPDLHPRMHYVSKDRHCSCSLGATCPSILAVAEYLRQGGERAPEAPHGFYPEAPLKCPVCGAIAVFDPALTTKRHGAGWICSEGGQKHYWRDRARIIKEALAANPWRFPPVVVRAGVQIFAWDGILPEDQVLYPGLLRAEIA